MKTSNLTKIDSPVADIVLCHSCISLRWREFSAVRKIVFYVEKSDYVIDLQSSSLILNIFFSCNPE
jgi:hypothetical protein